MDLPQGLKELGRKSQETEWSLARDNLRPMPAIITLFKTQNSCCHARGS